MQWTGFSLLLKDFSGSDSLRRSCPRGPDTGLRTELGLMDLTDVWERMIHWLRADDTSSTQCGQGSKGNITGKKNSEKVVRSPGLQSQPHGWPALRCLGSLWVGLSCYEMGTEEDMEKKPSNLLSFYYTSNHCNIHHRHSLNLIKTTTLESLYYFTDEDGEATVTGDCTTLSKSHH